MDSTHLLWPSLSEDYTDEFGVIDPEVYRVAGELWPQARQQALNALGDEQAGHTLLLKAAAQVTPHWRTRAAEILQLKAYLSQTFRRLLWAECRQELRRRAHSGPVKEEDSSAAVEEINKYLAIQQAMRKMDAWTLQVFELLRLGHSYEEIAELLGTRAVLVRVKYHKRLKQLSRQLR